MIIEKMKIYGVDGAGQESPTLIRTDDAIGLSYTVGASEIMSDFDNCYPWSDMKEVVDEFGNVFIRIPKFYAKITKNDNGTYKHQISGIRHNGFNTLFVDGKGNEIDYVLVGKYEGSYDSTNARMMSKSAQTVKVNMTITNYRNACVAVGEGYQQYDFLIDAIIKELFLIEFATTSSNSIMRGFSSVENTAALITGHTDNVSTPSGSWNINDTENATANTDGLHACKYRGIENLWGNTWTFIDGINFKNEKIYICESPTEYASDKYDAPYSYVGDRCMSSGYLKEVTPFSKNPLLGYATKNGASHNTYYSDYYYVSETGVILLVGGSWSRDDSAGLWCWLGSHNVSFSNGLSGGRLCYKPI